MVVRVVRVVVTAAEVKVADSVVEEMVVEAAMVTV